MKKDWPRLGLFFGDQILIEEKIEALKKEILSPEVPDCLNFQQIDLSRQNFDELEQAGLTPAFGASAKIIIVKNLPLSNKSFEENSAFYSQMIGLGQKSEGAVFLFFVFPDLKRKDLENCPFYQLSARAGWLFDLTVSWESKKDQLEDWIQKKIKMAGKEIEPEALAKLIGYRSLELADLASEIEKVITYAGENKKITVRMVDAVASLKAKEIYDLADAITSGRCCEALAFSRDLLREGVEISSVIQFLSRQFHLMLEIMAWQSSGLTPKQIQDKLVFEKQFNFYFVRKNLAAASKINFELLKKAIELLHRLDLQIKRGLTKPEIGFELLILELAQKSS